MSREQQNNNSNNKNKPWITKVIFKVFNVCLSQGL